MACFVHFLYSRDFYFTGARESPDVDLLVQRKRTKMELKIIFIVTIQNRPTFYICIKTSKACCGGQWRIAKRSGLLSAG